jgi:hypothetical protein
MPATNPLFIGLDDAARMVYHGCTGKLTDQSVLLTIVAHAIASRTKVFTRTGPDDVDYVMVWPNELMEGKLGLGGAFLEFIDGRAPLGYLSILRSEVPRLTEELWYMFSTRRLDATRTDGPVKPSGDK